MAKTVYDESSIQVLQGLEGVRRRPGMYIGSSDARGLHHLIWEIVDNSIDECLAGEADNIKITIHRDNSVTVTDNGRGIPIGKHKTGVPTPQVVFCNLHSGGKFDETGGYKVSGGLHGVGSAVVNALSDFLEVTITRDNKMYTQLFENGGSKINHPKITDFPSKKTGTKVHFKPDSTIFSTTLIDYKKVLQKVQESAFLVKGLKIEVNDDRSGEHETYQYSDGIVQYINVISEGKKQYSDPIYIEGVSNGIQVEATLVWLEKSYSENILSFVNNIRTRDGGTHETGFKSGITKAFNDYARMKKIIKDSQENLDGLDIREGMIGIVSVRIPESILQFEGQTKNKLGTADARIAVDEVISEKLGFYLAEKGEIASLLLEKSMKAAAAREAARKARDSAREIKKTATKPTVLAGKLSPTQKRDPERNELFLVEGDSAGGSARQGRDREFQAILPLRGKVINAEKTNTVELIKNEEILSIISSIGAGFGNDFNYKKSNYKKIIIMTDADTDGAHIQVLLLTFFFRYMRQLIEEGFIYIALPPLYKITLKASEIKYAWTDEELKEITQNYKNTSVQRFKGLGEINSEHLWDTTMNPETSTLIKVNIDDFAEADEKVSILMGDDVDVRKEWIETNVSFDYEDNFTLEEVEVVNDEF